MKEKYELQLRCRNCGHQWKHNVKKFERLYQSDITKSFPVISIDIGPSPLIDILKNCQKVICPHCYT
ncbi:MAG: hypothetical protein J7L15_04205, partial [Clostridiales bacterium]|nr:hypothetical protein [Clostridiales bacterium]